MHFLKRATCGALAGLMLLAAGCSGEDKTWVYRSGDLVLPAGAYIYSMFLSASEAESKLVEEHADDEDYTVPTKYKQLLNEAVDGQSFSDYVLAETDKRVREFIALEQQVEERGLFLSEEYEAYAENTVASYWESNTDFYEKNGIAQSSLLLLTKADLKRELLFNDVYGEGGDREVSRTELQQVFVRDYAEADVMVFPVQYTEEEMAEQTTLVEEYLQRAKDGEDFYDLIYEMELAQAEADEEADASAVEKPEPGSRSTVVSDDTRSAYGDDLVDGIFATAVGDFAMIEGSSTHYIIRRLDVQENEEAFEYYKGAILAELKEEEFEELISQWADEVTLESNPAALSAYTPAKLKMN